MSETPGKKAYEDLSFLHSPDARVLRIRAEYLEPQRRLRQQHVGDTIVFFGSARALPLEEARQLSARLTEWNLRLPDRKRLAVCTGGGPGIMEAANRGAVEAGGKSVRMNISLPMEQAPNPYITRGLSFEFHYFFMRKLWFLSLARALVVFPGGFGTLDEMFELLTLVQTSKVSRKLGILVYGSEFWKGLINWDQLSDWGVISPEDLRLIEFADDVDTAFERLTQMLG